MQVFERIGQVLELGGPMVQIAISYKIEMESQAMLQIAISS